MNGGNVTTEEHLHFEIKCELRSHYVSLKTQCGTEKAFTSPNITKACWNKYEDMSTNDTRADERNKRDTVTKILGGCDGLDWRGI